MMQNFRRNTRLILFIVVAAFVLLIFFEWGLNVTGITQQEEVNIARIDGVPVAYADYIRFAQSKEREMKNIDREDIWNLMIEEVIWNNLIKKENIRVVDEELWAIIKSNPPREIYESEHMKDSAGNFDYNKYLELIKSPQSRPWLMEYEFNLRRRLPREKLRSLISTMAWVSPFEDSVTISKFGTLYDFSFLSLPLFRLKGKFEITEDELKEYYNRHIKDFTNPEMKILKYVFFERLPSSADSMEARERLEDLLLRVKEGEDFLSVAREISDDTLIEKKFKDEKELLPYEVEVYKKLKDGEVSEIILTSRGYEVIKRAGKGLIYSAKVKINVSSTTLGELNDRIESFKNSVKELGFDEAAKEYNLTTNRTLPLNPDKLNFPVRNQEGFAKELKKLKAKKVIGPFSSFGGYYVFILDSIIPARTLSLDNEKEKNIIRSRYERERLKTAVKEYLEKVFSELQTTGMLEKIAEIDTILFFQPRLRDLTLSDVEARYGPEFSGVLGSLDSGQVSRPLLTEWAGYIIRCDNKRVAPFDTSMVKYIQHLRQVRLQSLSQSIFTPRQIIDNRDKFFE
ncbi:MAG: peptidyl-prolyl cis-trans isomerase [candidate division WOR-3 bacterium]|nr:peptidyl-prolyl cis-trans isomerase [candidate division WOR-3 bacterium]